MNGIPNQDYQSLVDGFNARNDTALLGCRLDQLFEKVVETFPDNTALIYDNIETSFKELNASANSLARDLRKRGLKHGDVCGLAVSRSMDLIVVMLAVLKLGAAYVPIDPSFPAKRLDQMIEDAGCKLVFVSDSCSMDAGLARWKDLCLRVGASRETSNSDTANLQTEISPQDLAYIIYTSGSTGRPKGVEISHGAAANFLSSLRKYEPGCDEHDRLLAITTISFDMSSLELLLPLISGSTMILANEGAVKNPRELIGLMRKHQATILQATPSTWKMLLESGWKGNPRLSKIICGGEPLSRALADRLLACADSVWNVYGPCETTYGSVGRVDESDIVVGNPIVNGRIYVLDDNMSPVPIGHEGEVYIGGASVANGYRNKPDLTTSVFLNNPFHGGKFFRTGDLARFIRPGKLQVIGRADGVVKIRGHRIEVGEVEAVLVDHPGVSEAVAISRDSRLVAYCVMHMSSQNAASLAATLRPWVTDRLPPYMIPSFFVPMAALPLSLNQKVDRKALPSPTEVLYSQSTLQPTSVLETKILEIWHKILGHNHIGVQDNFFSIGGDSVRLVRMQNLLEDLLHRPVPTPKLFEHHTIEKLAVYLAGASNDAHQQRSGSTTHQGFTSSNEEIAIISMACRLPGNVSTPEELLSFLQSGGDATTEVPTDRWDAEKLYHPDFSVDGKSYCSRGGFLSSVHSYDASFFNISPREAQTMDLAQHLMLELAWEGFERAGYTKETLDGTATGVFIGVSNNGTTAVPPDLKGYSITGSASATMSGRLSYTFNLQGPSMTVDTACSSSLVATHLACNALRQGECNIALAGGISLLLTPGIHIEFSRLRGLSPDGRCRAFSEDTEGTGFSEGAAIVLLKRLSDAKRDGDEIHAVLRGTTVMHGGHGAGLTVPHGPGQETLIRTALARSGLEPNSIDYIEAHGTATKLGDPIEASALAKVFGPSRLGSEPLRLGSVKSNMGHTQAAAGLVGLLKVVLSLKNKVIPRTLHVSEPTKKIDWENNNMELVLADWPWLPNYKRLCRAGVSAFGIGGTNAHVVIQEFPDADKEWRREADTKPALPADVLIILSARTESALRGQSEKLQAYIERSVDKENTLMNMTYSLATFRTHFQWRVAVTAKDRFQMLAKLGAVSSGTSQLSNINNGSVPRLAMLFTGQEVQHPGTGQHLYTVYPVFKQALDDVAAKFRELQFPLLEIMWPKTKRQISNRTEFIQPTLFALQVSLFRLWQSWGVKPAFLLGHSIGELAVAHVSGMLELRDACRLVLMRGRLMQAITRIGIMASIEASSDEVNATIQALSAHNKMSIAGYNTPCQTVVSGDIDAVEAAIAHFTSLGRRTKTLDTSHAFHSSHMDGMLEDFRAVASTVHFHTPNIPIVSSMTGRLAGKGEMERADYWVEQIRNPVRFNDAFHTLVKASAANVYLELGPSSTLCGMGAACLPHLAPTGEEVLWLPSLKPGRDETSVMQNNLGELHVRNVSVDWAAYYSAFGCQRVPLPTYAFQREDVRLPAKRSEDENKSKAMTFNVNWRQIDTDELRPPFGTWGVLPPAIETAWTRQVEKVLSSTQVRLVSVQSLQEAKELDGLLSLWDTNGTEDIAQVAQSLTVKALAQLQEAVRSGFALPVVWITHLAVGTDHDDRHLQMGAAPLWGLMRTARSEHPGLSLRLIDLDHDLEDVAQTLASGLTLDASHAEIAVRNKKLMAPRLERAISRDAMLPDADAKRLLRTDGAVLVTGGLGHLGKLIIRKLVKSHGVRDLVLTSRRGSESPGAEALVAELARLGAKTTILRGDIANLESLRAIMKSFTANRPLRGVIHAAGVVDSGILSSLTPQKCATTFAPKVAGLWNLHQLTKNNTDVDMFVMLSSISGVVGLPGLGNYAAANSFMDALAYQRRAHGLPATSMAYGIWSGDDGMATTIATNTRAHLSQLGLGFLAPEAGLEMLEQAVHRGRALTVAAVLNLERLKSYHEDQGGVPLLWRSVLSHIGSTTGKSMDAAVNLRDMLIRVTPEQHDEIMLGMVQANVAKALGYTEKHHLDATLPLSELGIDSLTSILIRNHLATMLGTTLPPNIALLHKNLKSLSGFLLTKLREDTGSTNGSFSILGDDTAATSPASSFTASHVDLSAIRRGILDSSIQFSNVAKQAGTIFEYPKNVFVTGPTGFLGAFMVHEFFSRGIDVYCLVRASNSNHAQERMVSTLKQYHLWNVAYAPLLQPIVGDLSKPLLGLSEFDFDDLANRIETIVHSGALVDWMRPLEDYVGPNIHGTHEVLRLASRGRAKAVHFISTISTLPIHLGYGLTEYDGEYGYGTSKYIAEKLVMAARFRGAKASSYRLPFVAASTANGQFRLDRGDFFNNLVSGSLDLGAFPSLNTDLSAVLPVDYLTNTIATITTSNQHYIGEDYDFVNPRAPSFDHFFQTMAALTGGGKELLSFAEWHRRALEYAVAHPGSSLARITTILDRYNDENAREMMKSLPVGNHVFGSDRYPAPLLDDNYVRQYLDCLLGRPNPE